MKQGKVVHFNPAGGYGFILGANGETYFAHCSKIVIRLEPRLYINEYVRFESVRTQPKPSYESAINIQPVAEIDDSKPYEVFKNPFIPRYPIIRPDKFAGRKQNIKEGTVSLVNKNNILITGDRGIGKSSFANQLLYLSEGDKYLLEKMKIILSEKKFLSYATISIRTLPNSTLKDVAGSIVRELITKFDLKKKSAEIEHEIDLKIYKFKSKSADKEKEFEDVLDVFGYDLIKLYDALQPCDGVIILIDEVENIDPSSNFANFVKNTSEYFISEDRNILFILSGIPCAITDLFFQHPSFLRLFEPIELKELATIESYELIDMYLEKQKKKINSKAKELICKVARGYPVNLQLLGFYSYQIDTDSYIDVNDVNFAIDHIIENIKQKDFLNKHESVGFGLPEDLLKFAITERQGSAITFEQIVEKFKDERTENIEDAIKTLEKNEIIYKYSKGNYFIKDYLFYRYLIKHYKT